MERILNIAITGAEALPIPAVHGGAVEVLVEELIKGNEENHKFNIDLYTVADPLLDDIKYKYCNIIQIPAEEVASYPNKPEEKTSPLGLALNERLKGKIYDFILVEHSMRIYNSIETNNKMIYHLHCDVDNEDFRPKAVAKKIINEAYCTLSVSEYTAGSMNKIVQSDKNKILFNCVDFDVFNPENVDYGFIKDFKEKNNIKEDDFCFIFSGRIHPSKGVLELVTAFKKLREENENVKLIIIGKPDFGKNEETPYVKELKEVSKNMQNDIIFTGFVDHDYMPTVITLGDCAVVPSLYEEAFGVVALEAMAMKKAVISSISGGLVEPLTEECAIFIDKENNIIENLYNAMKKISSDKQLSNKLGENGYSRVHSVYEFDSKNYFENFCKTIEIENFYK